MTPVKHELPDTGPTLQQIGQTIEKALRSGTLRVQDTSAIFYDLTFLEQRIRRLIDDFPVGTLHGLAVKANPLAQLLKWCNQLDHAIGVEAASAGEVALALKCGFQPDRIVFDSPVKTREEIAFALDTGIRLNVDNLQELERIHDYVIRKGPGWQTQSAIGLRINPQVGMGSIAESSVAGEYSKFGVPIRFRRAAIEQAFLTYSWLTGLHLHVGSQGCPVSMLIDGIGLLYDFMMEINEKRLHQGFLPISVFDIGGGLPVSYHPVNRPPVIEDYVDRIRQRAPALFPGTKPRTESDAPTKDSSRQVKSPVQLITEFGRWTFTYSGWTLSRVEYVKEDPLVKTAMLHVGADLFVRECLNPRDWQHEYAVFDAGGRLKRGTDVKPYNLAGPLCFSGDIIAREVALPQIEEGDFLVVRDTGSYTFSMWSRYNSRQTPRIVGYHDDGSRFKILRERESPEATTTFWE